MHDLYFIRAGDAVKIGCTGNIKNRLRMTQTHCPTRIELLACVKGLGWSEKVWHRAFSSGHRHGEWYALTPELETAIVAAKEGREWIAELQPTEIGLAGAERDWRRDPEDMERVFGSQYEYARRNRCNRIADFEEVEADRRRKAA